MASVSSQSVPQDHSLEPLSVSESDERSTWKVKTGRIARMWRKKQQQQQEQEHNDMNMTNISVAGDDTPGSESTESSMPRDTTASTNATSLPTPPEPVQQTTSRRRYLNGWIRYKGNSQSSSAVSTASSESTRPKSIKDAYRIALKDRFIRKHLIVCIVSGSVLLMLISFYLVYDINFATFDGQTYHIFFILLIMIAAMVFCHSFARTFLLATKVARYGSTGLHRVPSVVGPLGYAQPAHPIPVVLARDEEIAIEAAEAGQASEAPSTTSANPKLTVPPPAYGLWRSSVRINPNLLFWQRVDSVPNTDNSHTPTATSQGSQSTATPTESSTETSSTRPTTSDQPRPPSYVSDDGVSYAVQAQPRLTTAVPSIRITKQ